jgi:hypothetical protein
MTDYLDRLERQLIDAARVAPGEARRRHPSRRAIPAAVLVAALVLMACAVALAVSGVFATGTAVRPAGKQSARAGVGVPVPGGSRLLAASAPDPSGGLPWGMRLVHTTRGLVCLQIGRVQNGELGLLGVDGAFGNDARFHPFPADVLDDDRANATSGYARCEVPGAHISMQTGLPLSAVSGTPHPRSVAEADRRSVYFGLLGPAAVSVRYRAGGRLHTLAVEPGTGAYLLVADNARAIELETAGGVSGRGLVGPQGAVNEVIYRVGSRLCSQENVARPLPIAQRSHLAPCSHRELSLPRRPPRHLHHAIQVRVLPGGGGTALVTFKAPYRVASALSGYSVVVDYPCHFGAVGQSIERDVRAGEIVHARFEGLFANACGPHLRLQVVYEAAGSPLGIPSNRVIVGQELLTRGAVPR